MKIVFMGSPEFAVNPLNKLIQSDIDVSLVITQPDRKRNRNKLTPTPVKEVALKNNIDVLTPEKVNKDEIIDQIDKINPDFIVVIAFGQIIGKRLLETYKDRIINIHGSLLPKYRGAAPINWSIINGDKKTGVCSMLVEKSLDSGDVLDCREIEIKKEDDSITMTEKLSQLSGELIVSTLKNYEDLYKNRTIQGDNYTLAPKLDRDMGEIDWNKSATEIRNLVRGLKPWPSAFTYFGDEKVKIHDCEIVSNNEKINNGHIIKIEENSILVKANEDAIEIKELQFPNKKRMNVKDYLLGNTINVERLG